MENQLIYSEEFDIIFVIWKGLKYGFIWKYV